MSDDDDISAAGLPVLSPGLVLAGRFRLESVAGHGGMSVVWRATDMVLEHETALKFLPTVLTSDRGALADLRREARRARDLAHPQICRVYDYGEDPPKHLAWISMEYLPGGSLSTKLRGDPRGFLEPPEIIGWLRELCDALNYAHDVAHVVHRDLKPANLLIDSRGHLRVTDFGIARSVSESFTRLTGGLSPMATSRTGTAFYMSPQQARGDRPRPTDDLYSLGATVFELLTGQPPFTTGDVDWQREHAPPAQIAERRRALHNIDAPVPESWERFVQRLLAKHPSHRPQSAREVIAELPNLSITVPAPSAPPTTPQPAAQPTPKAAPTPFAVRVAPTKPPERLAEGNVKRMDPWVWALVGLLGTVVILVAILLWIGSK